jgi:hypothetical protein
MPVPWQLCCKACHLEVVLCASNSKAEQQQQQQQQEEEQEEVEGEIRLGWIRCLSLFH